MAEETYREYKEQQTAPSRPLLRSVEPVKPLKVVLHFRRRQRLPRSPEDYTVFKATIASAVDELKAAMHVQHEHTRLEVKLVRQDVLDAIKASPAEYVKLIAEFGSLFLVFSLAIRFTLKIELVNTAFALFMLGAFAVYWAMARLKEESDKRRHEDTHA